MGILESAASEHLKLLVVVGITQIIIPSPQNKEEFNFCLLISTNYRGAVVSIGLTRYLDMCED